jgi:PIN domain nuclease of toxin-antitoxin system
MILLDTHVLVWLDSGSDELGRDAANMIDREFVSDEVAVAAISFWEVAKLVAKGRLALTKPLALWRRELLAAGLRELPIDGQLGIAAAELSDFHGDPADRMIVATALANGCKLVTADRQILASPGSLGVIDAQT